jgi:hypothetical protein
VLYIDALELIMELGVKYRTLKKVSRTTFPTKIKISLFL